MISFLRGTYAGLDGDKAVIDVNGVGFAVGMSMRALSRMPEKGGRTQVYTHLQVREDDMSLYGFLSEAERDLFLKLVGVSGVGPRMALAALSTFEPSQLVHAIMTEDVTAVSRIPGVGKKTASRIVLELKGALEKTMSAEELPLAEGNPQLVTATISAGVVEALVSMGFTTAEVRTAMEGAPESADEGTLLQYALKRLGSVG
ncbi:MAG: Holliday junction branch migration protein RuvA [Eggerthellales bacterium]|nr:Holliday junction branch migration protein RuvA [Eggerthellales bacterium]